jgi:hypothetical protein
MFALAAGSAAVAEPLTFGAVDGLSDFSHRPDVAECRAAADEQAKGLRCTLKRSRFGGLAVEATAMDLNAAGKVRSVDIVLKDEAFEPAFQMLAGRYGPPATTRNFPRWSGFDDDAGLSIRKSGPNTIVSFHFPANDAAASKTGWPDAALAASLLLFTGLGLAAGVLVFREYGARRRRTILSPQSSMRATLERRLREGRDLQF